jgi:adenosine deaminase
MWEVVEYLRPERIGHGILCAYDEKLMRRVVEAGIVLEVCPTSNLRTRAVRDIAEVRHILDTLRANGVPFTINTDGPDMLMTTIAREYQFLVEQGIFTDEDVARCNRTAIEASFLNRTCPV